MNAGTISRQNSLERTRYLTRNKLVVVFAWCPNHSIVSTPTIRKSNSRSLSQKKKKNSLPLHERDVLRTRAIFRASRSCYRLKLDYGRDSSLEMFRERSRSYKSELRSFDHRGSRSLASTRALVHCKHRSRQRARVRSFGFARTGRGTV